MRGNLDLSDNTKCPVCGGANECAIVAGRDAESCWCMSVSIDPDALDAIPDAARGQICICARCANGATRDG
jgi:hypothetical protein